ncbi:hypothetical protein F4553_007296 [Allocatelliglobosispora scoriae]|uniref:DUF3866 family protein n=1 Tax=Allocatelliglobosispora scoriae TaxID=643052 RepID=A0A841C478_9ACTN|nr:DUF3866 family protein [Allocatelliglobosispora scoriae]MBB5873862.1 hypothetical protein [Allocatelliglobosispora scoriae]
MIRWRTAVVVGHGKRWQGAMELQVRLHRRADADPETMLALAYPQLVGEPHVGDQVLLNTGALAMGLGTGGYALVVAIPERLPADPESPGHIVKARYTPLQAITISVDEEASPHRETMLAAHDLGGMPVVTADLHSALPAIIAGIRADAPRARIAYVMTDGGALPAWFSRSLDALAPALAGVITAGQAFGGDLESVNVHSGLLAARHVLGADITVVAQGPGNLGTGTAWGYSGVAVGEAVNAVGVLGGRAIGSVRISDADPRDRHRGVSHHSITAYGRVALCPADLVVPSGLAPDLAETVATALAPLAGRHRLVTVDSTGLMEALAASPVRLSTMGRGLAEDTAYFVAAAAAGRHAAAAITT